MRDFNLHLKDASFSNSTLRPAERIRDRIQRSWTVSRTSFCGNPSFVNVEDDIAFCKIVGHVLIT